MANYLLFIKKTSAFRYYLHINKKNGNTYSVRVSRDKLMKTHRISDQDYANVISDEIKIGIRGSAIPSTIKKEMWRKT